MVLKAIGKYIDTLPIHDLLRQEEQLADDVTIEIDRFYGRHDLAEFRFFMRGLTQSGGEALVEIPAIVEETVLRLQWRVDSTFTTEAGTLALDLFAAALDETEEPQVIVRYLLPPVEVQAFPESESVLDSHSYTEFLLEVRAAANDAVRMIEQTAEEVQAEIAGYDDAMAQMQRNLTVLTERVAALEQRLEGVKPVVTLTRSEFEALETPDEDTLYVVT